MAVLAGKWRNNFICFARTILWHIEFLIFKSQACEGILKSCYVIATIGRQRTHVCLTHTLINAWFAYIWVTPSVLRIFRVPFTSHNWSPLTTKAWICLRRNGPFHPPYLKHAVPNCYSLLTPITATFVNVGMAQLVIHIPIISFTL